MSIGENIKLARKAAGETQKELADKIGVYQKDVSRWERDELSPSIATFAKICRELKVSADAMLELG